MPGPCNTSCPAEPPASERRPSRQLGRLSRLVSLGVKGGAGALLGRDPTVAAGEAAKVLGNLRGLAAKVGQMGSYVDGLVPEAQREAYENSLRVLRAQAPRSSPTAIVPSWSPSLGAPSTNSSRRGAMIPSRARPSAKCTARPSPTAPSSP